jgi:hypothetical protein
MKILRMLKSMITARGLEVHTLSKEFTMPYHVALGAVTMKKELSQDKIWTVINSQGQKSVPPIEYITSVTDKLTLLNDLLLIA